MTQATKTNWRADIGGGGGGDFFLELQGYLNTYYCDISTYNQVLIVECTQLEMHYTFQNVKRNKNRFIVSYFLLIFNLQEQTPTQ